MRPDDDSFFRRRALKRPATIVTVLPEWALKQPTIELTVSLAWTKVTALALKSRVAPEAEGCCSEPGRARSPPVRTGAT